MNSSSDTRSGIILFALSEFRVDASWFVQVIQMVSESVQKIVIVFFSEEIPTLYIASFSRLKNVEFHHINPREDSPLHSFIIMSRFIRLNKPHIVHAHGFFASIYTIPVSFLLAVEHRLITRHHGLLHFIERRYKALMIDFLMNMLATRIVVHSRHIKDSLINSFFSTKRKFQYIPLGITVEDFINVSNARVKKVRIELKVSEKDILIGLNSRPVKWKGVVTFLESARILTQKIHNIKFVIINMQKSKFSDELKRLSADLPIIFVETISDLPAFYKSLNVFCHVPTSLRAEPAGFVYLEAIASGVPSVFTISGLLPEIDLSNMPISIVNYGSPIQLSEAIIVSIGTKGTLSVEDQRKRLSKFTLLSFIIQHRLLYEKLIAGKTNFSLGEE